MVQTVPSPVDRRRRWRTWWLVIAAVLVLLAGIGLVRLVSIVTGPKPFDGHSGFGMSVAAVELDGTPVVVSGGADGTLRVWDLATGEPMRELVEGGTEIITVLGAEVGGAPVIISCDFYQEIRVWDVASGQPVGEPIRDEEFLLDPIGLTNVTGATAVVALAMLNSGPDHVRLWNLATGQPVGEPIGEDAGVELVAATVGRVRGRDVVGTLDDSGTVRIWDLARRELVVDPLQSAADDSLAELRFGHLHDTPIVVTASGYDPEVSVHNLDTGERIGQSVHGRGYLAALELGEVDGSPVIVAGHWNEPHYADKQIWVWDLATGEQLTEPFGHQPLWREYHGTSDLAIADLDGDPVVVSGDLDAMIRVWDLRTGDLLVGAGPWW